MANAESSINLGAPRSVAGRAGLDLRRLEAITAEALLPMDDGELYLEARTEESLVIESGRLKRAGLDAHAGFGLRAVSGERVGFACGDRLELEAIAAAARAVRAVAGGQAGRENVTSGDPQARLYTEADPIVAAGRERKVAVLQAIDARLRAADPRVKDVTASLGASLHEVEIVRGDGRVVRDTRPLVRLNVAVVVESGGRRETGSAGAGGRISIEPVLAEGYWQALADEALAQALLKLEAVSCPAGEMTVVLGPGWPGVMLHEAVGHGLEGDFNRKGTSAFAGLMGQRVAAPGVTVVDDGAMPDRRGSLQVDDEGTPTGRTVLIEDGILKGYLQDRQNARLMGATPTGNGRRQSYAHTVMPRMTNTFMLAGDREPEEILRGVDRGLYARTFGGGQVDITSGRFVFQATEAWLVEGGRLTAPVRGAMLIGNGPEALTRVTAIGNDLELDRGIGTCGKNGQGVPVGVGQPTVRLERLTVGGTAA